MASDLLRSTTTKLHLTRCLALFLACLSGAGCDGDDDSETADLNCGFEVTVTGSFSDKVPAEELVCPYTTNFDTGVNVNFAPLNGGELGSIALEIDEIMIDETGEFPAVVTLHHDDGRRFRFADCTVNVETHEPDPDGSENLGIPYHISGTGSCVPPGEEVTDPEDAITISEFRFSSPTVWDE
jgi:hypothetical protein